MAQKYETRESVQIKNEDSSNSFLLGALVGGLVGAAAALLFAPKSGKDFRDLINTEALLEKTGLIRETVLNKGSEWMNKTSSISQNLVQQSSDLLNKAKDAGKPAAESVANTVTQYIPLRDKVKEEPTSESMEAKSPVDDSDIKKKLEEAKKAFDEEENKIKQ